MTTPVTYSRGTTAVDRRINALADLQINEDLLKCAKQLDSTRNFTGTDLPTTNLTPSNLGIKSYELPHSDYQSQDLQAKKYSYKHADMHDTNTPITIVKTPIVVPIYTATQMTLEELTDLMLVFASLYYLPVYAKISPSEGDFLQNFIMFYGTIAKRFDHNSKLDNLLATTNDRFSVHVHDNFANFNQHIMQKTLSNQEVAGLNERDLKKYNSRSSVIARARRVCYTALVSNHARVPCIAQSFFMVIMQTIGRKPTPEGYKKWSESRLRASMRVVGGADPENWLSFLPPQDPMVTSYNTLGSRFPVKRELALSLYELANAESTIWMKLSRHTLDMLRFTEMVYVYNIDQFLCRLYPEVLSINLLKNESYKLKEMGEFLTTHEFSEHLKLFLTPEECVPIGRQRLDIFVVASTIIARRYYKSFENYKIDSTSPVYTQLSLSINAFIDEIEKHDSKRAAASKRFVIERSIQADILANLSEHTIIPDATAKDVTRPVNIVDSKVSDTKLT